MAKKFLTSLDLLALPSLTTPTSGSVGFGAKSDGLYQKIGAVETRLSVDGHTHPISDVVNLQTTLNNKLETSIFNTHNTDNIRHITGVERTKWDGVVTDFAGLEIGGRNLFSKVHSLRGTWYNNNGTTVRSAGDSFAIAVKVDKGGDYTINFNNSIPLRRVWFIKDETILGAQSFEWVNGVNLPHTINVSEDATYIMVQGSNSLSDELIASLKIEKGNKPTDWTPAPEDVQASIDLKANLASPTFTGVVTAPTFIGALSGNASTATKLATARTLTVGNKGKSFNGSVNVSWSLTEIGAASLSQSVLAGKGLTGGGTLAADRTITLGTPSNITATSTNSVAASSHTHNLALGGTASQYLNGTTTLVTIPTVTAGNGMTGGGQLTSSRTLTLGTPSTLTASTTNEVTASSHRHAITTTSVGAANTIVQTDATGGTKLGNLTIGDWSLLTEISGTRFTIKHGDAPKMTISTSGSGVVDFYSSLFTQDNITAGSIFVDGDATVYDLIAYETVITPQLELGSNWKLEQVGSELVFKYNNVIKARFLSDGSIASTNEISAHQ